MPLHDSDILMNVVFTSCNKQLNRHGDECRREGEIGDVREGGDKPTPEQA